jgi:hypothetical protein
MYSKKTVNYSTKTPINLEYLTMTFLGIILVFGVSIWAVYTYPDYSGLVLILVTPLATLLYCLIASAYMTEKEIISPVFQMALSTFLALAIDAIVYYTEPTLQPSTELLSVLLGTIFVYLLWISVSMYFHNLIRFLFGAHGTVESIDKYIKSFETTKSPKELVYEIKQRWVALLCGLRIVERKSSEEELKLRLIKRGTKLYIGMHGAAEGKKTYLHLVPYCIHENLRRKDILSNEDIDGFLKPQIEQIVKKLGLVECSDASSQSLAKKVFPDAIDFFLYPARFPIEMLKERKVEVAVVLIAIVAIMFLVSLRIANVISDSIFAGLTGTSVAIMLGVIGLRLRRS